MGFRCRSFSSGGSMRCTTTTVLPVLREASGATCRPNHSPDQFTMKTCKRHKAKLPCTKCRDIARHAALKRDAERYRHIRKGFYWMGNGVGLGYLMKFLGHINPDTATPEDILAVADEAIDEAMRRGE